MSGFDEFCLDLLPPFPGQQAKLGDEVVEEFFLATRQPDLTEIANLAKSHGYPLTSVDAVERFSLELGAKGGSLSTYGEFLYQARKFFLAEERKREAERESERRTVARRNWLRLLAIVFGAALLCAVGNAAWSIQWGILLGFAGRALGLTVAVNLVLWVVSKSAYSKGYETDRSHEWRYVTRGGSPGGRAKSASISDVYDHIHGSGSWEKRKGSLGYFCAVLGVVAVVACPLVEMSYLQSVGVQGVGLFINYLVIYPLLPLALIGVFWAWVVKGNRMPLDS